MKRIIPLILLLVLSATTVQAQLFKKKDKKVKTEYNIGTIPVVGNKVCFEETIPAEGLTAKEVEQIAEQWLSERFVKPTVIGFKRYEAETAGTLIGKSEEYLVFKNTFFVLNRTRIYYFITLTCNDGSCNFKMSRINYWWDDEAEDGGMKMTAEECITDQNAIDEEGRLKRFNGKFRTKTIDLKEKLIEELKNRLNSK